MRGTPHAMTDYKPASCPRLLRLRAEFLDISLLELILYLQQSWRVTLNMSPGSHLYYYLPLYNKAPQTSVPQNNIHYFPWLLEKSWSYFLRDIWIFSYWYNSLSWNRCHLVTEALLTLLTPLWKRVGSAGKPAWWGFLFLLILSVLLPLQGVFPTQ